MIFAIRGGLEQGPTLQGLKSDLVRQLLEDILSGVLRMDVQRFGPAIQKEKTADNCAKTFHGLKEKQQFNIRGC